MALGASFYYQFKIKHYRKKSCISKVLNIIFLIFFILTIVKNIGLELKYVKLSLNELLLHDGVSPIPKFHNIFLFYSGLEKHSHNFSHFDIIYKGG